MKKDIITLHFVHVEMILEVVLDYHVDKSIAFPRPF